MSRGLDNALHDCSHGGLADVGGPTLSNLNLDNFAVVGQIEFAMRVKICWSLSHCYRRVLSDNFGERLCLAL